MNGFSQGIALVLLLGLGWWVGAEEMLPSPPGEEERPLEVIVIDPGHGGPDVGARGLKGLREKDVTLRAAQVLKEMAQERLGVQVVLTREGDYALPLERRATLANTHRASLFISLHASGAFGPRPGGGFQVFSLKPVAGRQKGLLSGGNGEVLIPWRQLQWPFVSASRQLAGAIQKSLNEWWRPGEAEEGAGAREAPCALLMGVRMPAVLVELGHLGHPEEAVGLQDEAYLRDLGGAILHGIQAYRLQVG